MARHEYKCHPPQHVQPWQKEEEKHPHPIGPSRAHAHSVCALCCWLLLVLTLKSLRGVVYWAWSRPPGTSTPPPAAAAAALPPYPPFDVSHIPFSVTLIVFCNYFHPSAIVTGRGCTALYKLVRATRGGYEKRHVPTREAPPTQALTCTTRWNKCRMDAGLKQLSRSTWETLHGLDNRVFFLFFF